MRRMNMEFVKKSMVISLVFVIISSVTGCASKSNEDNADVFVSTDLRYTYNLSNQATELADVNEGEFNTEEYNQIKENRYLSVKNNPLSTFSADVPLPIVMYDA